MTSMTHPSVATQTTPLAVPALPHWFGEVSLVAQYLTHLGILEASANGCAWPVGAWGPMTSAILWPCSWAMP